VQVPALEAQDVSMRRCGRSLVQRVSITADRGELLVLCGPEGSGTRTLLHLLSGHLQTDAGRVLVDGRERSPRRRSDFLDARPPDPRHLAYGPEESAALLTPPRDATAPSDQPVLLLERPTAGLDADDCHALLVAARRRADEGCAVVLTADAPDDVAAHATTLALFVAGRLLSWGAPPVALVPALHILGAGGMLASELFDRTGQAGSIITSST
jgi:iron complex transport system ATP-binding protein